MPHIFNLDKCKITSFNTFYFANNACAESIVPFSVSGKEPITLKKNIGRSPICIYSQPNTTFIEYNQ